MSDDYEQGVEALDNLLNRESAASNLVDISLNVIINKKIKISDCELSLSP